MSAFESKVTINQPVEKVYSFLNNLNNHQALMPESISNWSSTENEARFTIQNMANIALKIDSQTENKEINIVPSEKAPIPLNIKWQLEDKNGQTDATLKIDAELNMMMKMVASGPLQKLADHQTAALARQF